MKMFRLLAIIIIAMTASLAQSALVNNGGTPTDVISSVPRSMTYQGILKNGTGSPVEDTTLNIIFRIYSQPVLGILLWEQMTSVTTDENGYFNASLDNINLSFSADYYLDMQVDGEPAPMTPRQKLSMSAYAARADTSQYSVAGGGWLDAGTVVRLNNANDDVGVGVTTPGVKLDVGDMIRVQGQHYPDFPTAGAGLEMAYRPSDNTGMIQVYDRDASQWGDLYLGSGNVGISTSNPSTKLHVVGDVTVTGAMITPFPRPAYDSGWFTVGNGSDTTLVHNLGGTTSDYFVDLQMRYADNTISNLYEGGDFKTVLSVPYHYNTGMRD